VEQAVIKAVNSAQLGPMLRRLSLGALELDVSDRVDRTHS
jgi:hypothetical protein